MNTKVAAIQMTSGLDLDANLAMAKTLLEEAAAKGAVLAVLPEMFALLGRGDACTQAKRAIQEEKGSGKIQDFLSATANRLNMWIVGGTIPLKSHEAHRSYAACLVYNADGENIAEYDKIHLFDANLSHQECYAESSVTMPGDTIVVIDTPIGRIGLSVCYDIRFPELFREMFRRGAQILMVPAAFTVTTGQVHWEVLLRARAIENFCYVVASAEWGVHGGGRETFGDSMIIAPTGEILSRLAAGTGVVIADIDLEFLNREREKIPVGSHQRIFHDVSALSVGAGIPALK